MRADRLLAELLLLQRRDTVTAAELAERLEVSPRTVYRDMEALQMAGVPVVSLAGPGGGYSLYGEWRVDLAGLSGDEMTALSVAMVAGPPTDAAVAKRIRTAVMKVGAALPESARRGLERLQHRVHVDSFVTPGSPRGVLGVIAAALQDGLGIHLVRRGPSGTRVTRTGTPLGLVVGNGEWHLVWVPGAGPPRAERLDDVLEVETVPAAGDEPEGFDLAAFWEAWRDKEEARRPVGLHARLRVAPDLLPQLRRQFGPRMQIEGEDPPVVHLLFGSIYAARAAILAWGGAAEVLAPEALRLTVADFAEQAADVYRG